MIIQRPDGTWAVIGSDGKELSVHASNEDAWLRENRELANPYRKGD
jgi:hypothetical protein